MEYKRRDYFITFTMLGLSAAALMAYQYAGALLFGLAETWAKSQETGVFRWFSCSPTARCGSCAPPLWGITPRNS